MNFLKTMMASALLIALVGCEERPIEACPQAGRDFLEKSIRAHFDKSYPQYGGGAVQILSDEEYNPATKSWIVSVDAPNKDYFALVSCSGRVELSGRQLGPLSPPKSR